MKASQDEKQAQKSADIYDDNTDDNTNSKISSQIPSQKKSKIKHKKRDNDDNDDNDDIIVTKNISATIKPESKPPIMQTCPKCGNEVEAFYMKIHRCEGTN